MTTISTKRAADVVARTEPTPRRPDRSVAERRVSWRMALECAWQRKIDEAIALSRALCGLTSDDDVSAPCRGARESSRLQVRTVRAYDELAAIEDAICRIDDGTYGVCVGCDQAMSDEWLAAKPEARYCPGCSMRLAGWHQTELSTAPASPEVQRASLSLLPVSDGGGAIRAG